MSNPERAAALASVRSPDTRAAVLEQVMRDFWRDDELIEQLVRHPNLQLKSFVTLAARFPLAAVENPALELFALEDPGWIRRLGSNAVVAMVLAPLDGERVAVLAAASSDFGARASTARKLVPPAVLERVRRHPPLSWEAELREQLRLRAERDPTLRGVAVEIGRLDHLAGAEWLPAAWVEVLTEHPLVVVRTAVAVRATLAPALVRKLAADPDVTVRSSVASRSDLDADLIARLAGDGQHAVRLRLVSNPHVPTAVVRRLLADPSPSVALQAWKRLDP